MGDGGDFPKLVPRLCHVVRWSDFNGYGFNLHAEKGKAGQYIGKVDEGSPAETAGLKQGDRIVEVNGVNVGVENHQQVVSRIKAGGEETRLLVVDSETDQYYKDEKKIIKGDLPEVVFLTAARNGPAETPSYEPAAYENDANGDATTTTTTTAAVAVAVAAPDESDIYRPRLCKLCKWPDFDGYGFNLHAEKDKPGQYIGAVDAASPAEAGGLRELDRIVEVDGENIETCTHSSVIARIKAGGERTSMLVVDKATDEYYKARGQTVTSAMANVVVYSTPPRNPEGEKVEAEVAQTVESAPVPVPVPEENQNGTSNGINGGTEDRTPEPEPVVPEPIPEPVKAAPAPEPEPEPAVIRSTTSQAAGDLNLNLSAAEMKERLKNRRKQDPRLQKQSFEQKHKMFEKL